MLGNGDPSVLARSTAVQVAGLTRVTVLATGNRHALALRNDGTVWAWGGDEQGQLGDGAAASRVPVKARGHVSVQGPWR